MNCPGPVGLFLQRIHAVGWAWDPSRHLICDAVSSFDLWHCSPQELQFRLCDAWRAAVARQCCHRPGFQGLDTADVDLTRRSLDKLAASDKASLRIALNGTFFTQDALKHFDMHLTGNCRFCGEPDSLPHRVYDCGFFREGREATGFAALVSARDLLPAQGLHAWGQQAPSLPLLRGQLTALRDEPHSALDLGGMDLFTDGSCLQPQQPCLRLASWAIVSDPPAGTPSVVASGRCLACSNPPSGLSSLLLGHCSGSLAPVLVLSVFGPTVLGWYAKCALSGQRSVRPQPWRQMLISGWMSGRLCMTWPSALTSITCLRTKTWRHTRMRWTSGCSVATTTRTLWLRRLIKSDRQPFGTCMTGLVEKFAFRKKLSEWWSATTSGWHVSLRGQFSRRSLANPPAFVSWAHAPFSGIENLHDWDARPCISADGSQTSSTHGFKKLPVARTQIFTGSPGRI